MFIYKKAFDLMKTKGINVTQLRRDNVITQSALTSMRRNGHVNMRSIEKLCRYLDCQPGDLMEYVRGE